MQQENDNIKFEITKEQIIDAYQNKALLKEYFPDAFKKELKKGYWYWSDKKAKKSKSFLFLYNGKSKTYGFGWNSKWYDNLKIGTSIATEIEATSEEVYNMFQRELIKRYGEDWKNIKIDKCLFHGEIDLNKECYVECISVFENGRIWNMNGCIFDNGKWAKPIIDK